MSYARSDVEEPDAVRRAFTLPKPERMLRVAAWSVVNAALLFVEHLAEMLAPLLLLAGGVWWAIPRVLGAITLEGQAADMLETVRSHVPEEVFLDGSYYSAGALITDALWLVAAVAICRTLSTALAALLLDQ